MEHQSSFVHFLEGATPLDKDVETSSIKQAVRFLLDFAHRYGSLETEAAWRLSSTIERRLEKESGYRPPGGWSGLAALLAGTPHLHAESHAFVPRSRPGQLSVGEMDLRRELVETMTRRLVPPATAASIFIALSVHPAWGLRLAWEIQHRHKPNAPAKAPGFTDHLPVEQLESVREGVFTFIAVIIGVLRRLDEEKSYAIDTFGELLGDAVIFARGVAEKTSSPTPGQQLRCFTGGVRVNRRIAAVLSRDLLDEVFIPAGVARDIGDSRFHIASDVLESAAVDEIDRNRQDRIFEDFVSSRGQSWGGDVEGRR